MRGRKPIVDPEERHRRMLEGKKRYREKNKEKILEDARLYKLRKKTERGGSGIPGMVYVVTVYDLEANESFIGYAGPNRSQAYKHLAGGDNLTYRTEMECWIRGERVE